MLFVNPKLQDGKGNFRGAGNVYPMNRIAELGNSFALSYWEA